MSPLTILLLVGAGFFAGAINAIAGGGTFLTFGALTLIGLPPVIANATSSIIQFPGYITSTLAYKDQFATLWRSALVLALISIVGSLGGSLFLMSLSNPTFRSLVPWLLIAATLIFAIGPKLKPKVTKDHATTPLGIALQTVTSFYGGFFGAGMGIMMLASLSLATGGDYHRLNALKNFLAIVIAAVAIVVFSAADAVAWREALIMVPAVAIGGYIGVHTAKRAPQSLLRGIVIAAGFGLSIYYFITG